MQFNLSPSKSKLQAIQDQLDKERDQGIRDIWVCVSPCYLAVEEDGVLVGVASLSLGTDACELYKLYVPSVHRGKGIASSLVEKAIEISKNIGASELQIEIAGESRGFWGKITQHKNIECISCEKFVIKI